MAKKDTPPKPTPRPRTLRRMIAEAEEGDPHKQARGLWWRGKTAIYPRKFTNGN